MILASFNLPTVDNNGASLAHLHEAFAGLLVDRFGGATISDGAGLWRHNGKLYREPVKVYSVAIDREAQGAFRDIAIEAGREAGQLAVFLTVDGKPEIAELEAPAIAAE